MAELAARRDATDIGAQPLPRFLRHLPDHAARGVEHLVDHLAALRVQDDLAYIGIVFGAYFGRFRDRSDGLGGRKAGPPLSG